MSEEKHRGWRSFGERHLLSVSVFDVKAERWRCPRSGHESDFYTLRFGDWVNVVALTPDRRLVMIRQFRHGKRSVEIEIPGGLLEKEETPAVGGARELLEETGYVGRDARVIGKVCPNPALQGNWCYTVLITDAKPVSGSRMDPGEDIETFTLPFDEVKAMVRAGEITHGLVLNAFWFLDLAGDSSYSLSV